MRIWAALLILVSSAYAQGAASITTRGRNIESILELSLFPASDPPRAVMLVIDATPSLALGDFAGRFAAVIKRNRDKAKNLQLGVAFLGTEHKPLPPGASVLELVPAVQAGMRKPKQQVHDVYAAVRKAIPLVSRQPGRREIVLVTLENGDVETKLESTVAALTKAKVRLTVVAREAFLSDSYWLSGSAAWVKPPKGATTAGPDGAFIDVPWGWLFQYSRINEVAPSGHAMYGLSRLAAASGGQVHIYYPKRGKHSCSRLAGCLFCKNDHTAPYEMFRAARLKAMEPLLGTRKEIYKVAAHDPYYVAVLEAWSAAAKAGLTRVRPMMRPAGGSLVPEKRIAASAPAWTGSSWKRWARSATKLAGAADRIAHKLRGTIEKAKGGNDRYRSIAELTYLMLRLTRVNLLYCAAYCNEIGPTHFAKKRAEPQSPERAVVPPDYRITGLGYSTMSLCHGVQPFYRLHLPGGDKLKQELVRLDTDYKKFMQRNAYSPFAIAIARMGIARFHPVGIGKRTKPLPRDISGTDTSTTTTRPDRGGGTSGGSTGPTSGG